MFRLSQVLGAVFYTVLALTAGYVVVGMALGFMPPLSYIWYHLICIGFIFGAYKSVQCAETIQDKKYWAILDDNTNC